MVSLNQYYEDSFFEGYEEDEEYYYDDGEVWDEDLTENWSYWKTRWGKVELDQREELVEEEDYSERVEMDEDLKEHQIYFLGLPEDIQKKIFNLVNPLHKYVYSS